MDMRGRVDRIYEAVQMVNQVYEDWSLKHGITLYEMQVYYIILGKKEASITQRELCEKLDAPKTSINSIIKKQLNRGYIQMTPNPQDKREKIISLTKAGEKFAKDLIIPLFEHEEETVRQFSEDEFESAVNLQVKFAQDLRKRTEK